MSRRSVIQWAVARLLRKRFSSTVCSVDGSAVESRPPSPEAFSYSSEKDFDYSQVWSHNVSPNLVSFLKAAKSSEEKIDALRQADSTIEAFQNRFQNVSFPSLLDKELCNQLIRTNLEVAARARDSERWYARARNWYRQLAAEFNAAPDHETFSLLIEFCIQKGMAAGAASYWDAYQSSFPSQSRRQLLDRIQIDEADKLKYLNSGSKYISVLSQQVRKESETLTSIIPQPSDAIRFVLQSVSSLREINLSREQDLWILQERLERDFLNSSLSRMRQEYEKFVSISEQHNLCSIRNHFIKWTMEISQLLLNSKTKAGILSNALRWLSAETMILLALIEFFKIRPTEQHCIFDEDGSSRNGRVRFVTLASEIGLALEREIFAQNQRSSLAQQFAFRGGCLEAATKEGKIFDPVLRERLSEKASKAGELFSQMLPSWNTDSRVSIGVMLIELLVKNAFFQSSEGSQLEPAFIHRVDHESGPKTVGYIYLAPSVLEKLSEAADFSVAHPAALPMLVPPVSWTSFSSGGYLTYRNTCIRLKNDSTQLAYTKESDSKNSLFPVLAGLNILNAVQWEINRAVLDVVIEAWNSGLEIGALPPRLQPIADQESSKTIVCEKPSTGERIAISGNMLNSIHSQRCDLNYKLEIANAFRNLSFYFPHNIDFRGRAYPIPPNFNHIGSDICRGLLRFHERKRVGAEGIRWLKIHLANLYGCNKLSFQERIKFVEDRWVDIQDSADAPLSGRRWWAAADDPWQSLAVCMELVAVLRSPVPEDFKSGQPVHQDGSCNGLQHYAALGRDSAGAAQVNLQPSDRPQDVYSTVAMLVERLIEKDINGAEPSAAVDVDAQSKRFLASLLSGKVTRKIVKQTVMTNVYGVTPFGARAQIQERLVEGKLVPPEQIKAAACYLASKVFSSLDQLFTSARKIQNWLTMIAEEITLSVPSKLQDSFERQFRRGGKESSLPYPFTLLSWVSPLGYPAVQPYRHRQSRPLRTALQVVSINKSNEEVAVDVRKQRTAFPPNFIHSMDATHMIMTALRCSQDGITFASVHDSFWTHPGDVSLMRDHCSQAFVELYRADPGDPDVLERTRNDLLQRYADHVVPVFESSKFVGWRKLELPLLPAKGDFDISAVRKSDYFFS